MKNPSLNHFRPTFSQIKIENIETTLDNFLKQSKQNISRLLNQTTFSWENLIQPLEEEEADLEAMWSPISHLNNVANNPDLREVYNACLPKLTDYYSEMGQNKALYQAFLTIKESGHFATFDPAQKKIILDAIRDFRLAGVALDERAQQTFRQLQKDLSSAMNKFSENILDATDGWYRHITDANELDGIPDNARSAAQESAKTRGLTGWVFTLEAPSYFAVINNADSGPLREDMYVAYSTRASDQGPNDYKWDNSQLIEDILSKRHQTAQLLGFDNYAQLSLATKMAKSEKQVFDFLEDLAKKAYPVAQKEFQELNDFAKQAHGIQTINAWDIGYYSEKLRQHKYDVSREALRPYFPEDTVIEGMFTIFNRLFGITFKELPDFDSWHPDVRLFEIYDKEDNLRGELYFDLYARANKQSGAWADACRFRCRYSNGHLQYPVGYLICNFSAPTQNKPALFAHDEVVTLFHEFGHSLHHVLSQIDYPSVSGLNGVAWDAVEYPSQLLENWCWDKEALGLISSHYQTGESIPDEMIEKMQAARNFQAGMLMVRQLEFALFDFRLHAEYAPGKGGRVQEILNDVRLKVCVVPMPSFNRFQHGFSHIFDGGYGAGYYSYKWAEVLSSDSFSKFQQEGIFNQEIGLHYMRCILEKGGSEEPMTLYKTFMGREPKVEALLQQCGIISEE